MTTNTLQLAETKFEMALLNAASIGSEIVADCMSITDVSTRARIFNYVRYRLRNNSCVDLNNIIKELS